MKKIILTTFLFGIIAYTTTAQKIKILKGDVSCLKGQTEVNMKYEYDELHVSKLTESEYVEKKVRDYEAKEPGKGAKFKESWETSRVNRYHPKYEQLINENVPGTAFGNKPDAEYTMVVNSKIIDPGFNVGVSKKPAYLDCEVKIIDKSGNEKCVISVVKAPGSQFGGYDYDAGTRIAECYAITGKRIGALIKKANK